MNEYVLYSRPSEHPPVRGERMSKLLSGIMGCKDKTSSWHLNGFPDDGSNISCSDFSLTGPHAFGPKKIFFVPKILMKQPHDCSY